MTHFEFSVAFLCRCHPVHFLLIVLVTMNRIHIPGSFNHRPENLQFVESGDG